MLLKYFLFLTHSPCFRLLSFLGFAISLGNGYCSVVKQNEDGVFAQLAPTQSVLTCGQGLEQSCREGGVLKSR